MGEELKEFMKDFAYDFSSSSWDAKDKVLFGSACFLGGVLIGFIFSPIKRGISIASNNGKYVEREEEK